MKQDVLDESPVSDESVKHRLSLNLVSKYRDAIYGFAILWIVVFHGTAIDKVDFSFGTHLLDWLQVFVNLGGVGVDIFLFLSGICLYFSYIRHPNIRFFYLKRLARVVLPVWTIYGVYWLIRYWILKHSLKAFLGRMSLAQFWISGDQSIWFVALILVLYLLYPVIFHVLFCREKRTVLRFLVLIGMCYIGIVAVSILVPKWYKLTEIALTRIPVFIFGCWMGQAVYEQKTVHGIWGVVAFATATLFVVLLNLNLFHGMTRRFIYLVGGVSLAYCLALIFAGIDSLVSNRKPCILRFLSFVGMFSLELYLSHIMVNQVLQLSPWYMSGSVGQYGCVVLLALVLAWITMKLCGMAQKHIVKWGSENLT